MDRFATYDFLLTFYIFIVTMGLSRAVSEINDFSGKSPIFPTPCILPPVDEGPLELGVSARVMMLPS